MNNPSPCPYLRLKDDPDTWAGYPSRSNYCHHAWPNQQVAPLYQQHVCFTDAHQTCPVFKREGLWPGKLPPELRTDAAYEEALKKHSSQAVMPPATQPPAPITPPETEPEPIPPVIDETAVAQAEIFAEQDISFAEPDSEFAPEPPTAVYQPVSEPQFIEQPEFTSQPEEVFHSEEVFQPESEEEWFEPVSESVFEPAIPAELPTAVYEPVPEPETPTDQPTAIYELPAWQSEEVFEPESPETQSEPVSQPTFESAIPVELPTAAHEPIAESEPEMVLPFEPEIPDDQPTLASQPTSIYEPVTASQPEIAEPVEAVEEAPPAEFMPDAEPGFSEPAPADYEEDEIDAPDIAEPDMEVLDPPPVVLDRISPAAKIEISEKRQTSGNFDPVAGDLHAVSPGKVAAEIRAGVRPIPPSGRPSKVVYSKAEKARQREEARARKLAKKQAAAKKAEPKPQTTTDFTVESVEKPAPRRAGMPRRLMLVGGIIGAFALCALLGAGGAAIMRGMLNAAPDPTATPTETTQPTPTATLDEAGTATASAMSISPTAAISTATTSAATTTPISVQETRMRFDGNLRSGPGTEYAVLGEVAAGSPISVIGRDELGVWLTIRLATGQEGWIPASQVDTDTINVLSAPVVEATYAPAP